MKNKYTFRKLVNDLHLWVGLPSAVILFVMCLTGTMYVFQKEITQWVDSAKFGVIAPDDAIPLPADQLKELVEKDKHGKVTTISIPQSKQEAWTLTVLLPEKARDKEKVTKDGKEKKKEETASYLVNQYTGEIQGDAKTPTSEFFATVLKMHRWLLLDHDFGGVITGTAALMMLFLQISGLVLWFPAKVKSWKNRNAWKPGFKVKTDAKFKRVNFDLHKALGFYAFVFVTIMALTGPYFVFEWYKKGSLNLLNAEPPSKANPLGSTYPPSDAKPLSLDQIVKNVNRIYPYAGNVRLSLPKDSSGSIAVQKSAVSFLASAAIDRVTLDQYSGKVLKLDRYADKRMGEKVIWAVKFIHTGELFGTFSKTLYFIACLIATSLPVTGFLIWWSKGKPESKAKNSGSGGLKRRSRKLKHTAATPAT